MVKLGCRQAEETDVFAISELLQVVFAETYGHVLEHVVLEEHLNTYLSEDAIRKDISSSSYYVVEALEGCLGVLKLVLDDRDKAEIAKLYVLGEARAQGVGSQLMDAALKWSKEQNAKTIWLNVWQENKKAIQFYEKHNFKQVGFTDVFVGEVAFKDFVMERVIKRTV